MAFLAGLACGLILALLAAALWARQAVSRPLAEISRAAEGLARGEEQARVRLPARGTLGRLGATLNFLAERIQHDISELRRLEQIRKDFVANVSHELRTPLASIKAFAETLASGGLEDKANRLEFVSEIERNADRMTRLVDDLLQISALEAGRMPPAFESLSLMRVAAEVAAGLKPLAEKKGIVLRLEPFGDLPQVRADRSQLKQVLVNLIDNAIKYGGENGVVRISARSTSDGLTVSVQDTGPGIPPEDRLRVFERFYRVDKARSRELGGTGLGLSIVKHIVELHGGSAGVDAPPEGGSRFHFTLPSAS